MPRSSYNAARCDLVTQQQQELAHARCQIQQNGADASWRQARSSGSNPPQQQAQAGHLGLLLNDWIQQQKPQQGRCPHTLSLPLRMQPCAGSEYMLIHALHAVVACTSAGPCGKALYMYRGLHTCLLCLQQQFERAPLTSGHSTTMACKCTVPASYCIMLRWSRLCFAAH